MGQPKTSVTISSDIHHVSITTDESSNTVIVIGNDDDASQAGQNPVAEESTSEPKEARLYKIEESSEGEGSDDKVENQESPMEKSDESKDYKDLPEEFVEESSSVEFADGYVLVRFDGPNAPRTFTELADAISDML